MVVRAGAGAGAGAGGAVVVVVVVVAEETMDDDDPRRDMMDNRRVANATDGFIVITLLLFCYGVIGTLYLLSILCRLRLPSLSIYLR